jgi:hypothetical protein
MRHERCSRRGAGDGNCDQLDVTPSRGRTGICDIVEIHVLTYHYSEVTL